jgi:excisionase family DNA binding protein
MSVVPVRAFTIKEVCTLAHIGRTSLYEAIRRGELQAHKRGRRTLIFSDDLERWLYSLPPISPGQLSNGPTEIVRPTVVGSSADNAGRRKTGKEA